MVYYFPKKFMYTCENCKTNSSSHSSYLLRSKSLFSCILLNDFQHVFVTDFEFTWK